MPKSPKLVKFFEKKALPGNFIVTYSDQEIARICFLALFETFWPCNQFLAIPYYHIVIKELSGTTYILKVVPGCQELLATLQVVPDNSLTLDNELLGA